MFHEVHLGDSADTGFAVAVDLFGSPVTNVDIYFDASTNTFTALELWDTADHYRAYLQYRTDQGIADAVAPVLEGGWDGVLASVKWLGEKTDI